MNTIITSLPLYFVLLMIQLNITLQFSAIEKQLDKIISILSKETEKEK